jgi:hypothetical protein
MTAVGTFPSRRINTLIAFRTENLIGTIGAGILLIESDKFIINQSCLGRQQQQATADYESGATPFGFGSCVIVGEPFQQSLMGETRAPPCCFTNALHSPPAGSSACLATCGQTPARKPRYGNADKDRRNSRSGSLQERERAPREDSRI